VSIQFRQSEGSNAITRTITNLGAAGVVSHSGAAFTTPVGRVFEITGSGDAASNALGYTCVASGAGTITLRPAPNAIGASGGSLISKNLATARTLGATAIVQITALPGPGNLAMIQVTGANFLTNEIEPNDRAVVTGALAANNGAWYVQEILSEDVIIVRPPDGGAGMTTEAPGAGVLAIRAGCHVFDAVSETTLGWQRYLDIGVPVPGPTGAAPNFGSGNVRDYIRRRSLQGARTSWQIFGVSRFRFNQSALAVEASWVSEDEVVVIFGQNDRGNIGDAVGSLWSSVGAWSIAAGNGIDLRLGAQPGNRFSCNQGSVWVGARAPIGATGFFNGRCRLSMFGSYFDHLNGPGNIRMVDGDATGVIARGGIVAEDGTIQHLITYEGGAFFSFGAGSQDTVLIGYQDSGASINTPGAVLGGLTRSDAVSVPTIFNISTGLITFLDPTQNDPLADYTSIFFATDEIERRYTFNPIFSRVEGLLLVPVANLPVRIVEINETTLAEVEVFAGNTDANGRLAAGVGTPLRRERLAFGVNHFYTHRVEMGGTVSQVFKFHAFDRNERSLPQAGVVLGPMPQVVVVADAVAALLEPPISVVTDPTPEPVSIDDPTVATLGEVAVGVPTPDPEVVKL
jgi:hypothetical protein